MRLPNGAHACALGCSAVRLGVLGCAASLFAAAVATQRRPPVSSYGRYRHLPSILISGPSLTQPRQLLIPSHMPISIPFSPILAPSCLFADSPPCHPPPTHSPTCSASLAALAVLCGKREGVKLRFFASKLHTGALRANIAAGIAAQRAAAKAAATSSPSSTSVEAAEVSGQAGASDSPSTSTAPEVATLEGEEGAAWAAALVRDSCGLLARALADDDLSIMVSSVALFGCI